MKWVALVGLLACAPTETGNPVTVALSAHSSDPDAVGFDGNALRIDSLWMGFGDIRFVLAADCAGGGDVQILGPIVTDLAADPFLQSFEPSTMEYCRVSVVIDPVVSVPSGAPADLLNHSVRIEGMTPAGTPFVLRSAEDVEVDVNATTDFLVDGALVLSFDVARWFERLDVDSGTAGPDGVIVIDDENNSDLLDEFEDRFEEALELYDDDDDDGRRDDDEERLADSDP